MPAHLTIAVRFEKKYQARRLYLHGYNQSQIARALHINRKTVKCLLDESWQENFEERRGPR